MIKSINISLKNIIIVIMLPLLVQAGFDIFTEMNVPHWDTGRYFMVFLASVFVYLTYERIKPFKSVVGKICLEVFFKNQILIIVIMINVSNYIRMASDVSYQQSDQEFKLEAVPPTNSTVPKLNLQTQSVLSTRKLQERSGTSSKKFIASDTVSQLQSFHEKVKVVMANANVSAQSLTKEQEMHLMNIGMQLAQYAQRNQWDEFEKIVLAESADPDKLTALTNAAIALGAPVDMIENFVNQGAQIFPTSTLHALSQGRIEFVKQLENFGVNLVDDSSELHVLDMAMMMPMPAESFEFLLDKSFDLMSYKPSMGIDTLGIAIVNAPINPTASPRFVQALLNKGVQLNSHHVELLQRIAIERPDIHADIVKLSPDLGI